MHGEDVLQSALKTAICHYHYDALDRLTAVDRAGQESLQRFYCRDHLVSELQGASSQSVLRHGTQLLALQAGEVDDLNCQLLTTDQQRSVLQVTDAAGSVQQAYAPYGNRRVEGGSGSLLGFTGETVDSVTGHYLLGNGHRGFNPLLMRFNSPDRFSPFGRGGLNPYAYCMGNPVNFSDPTGRAGEPDWQPWLFVAMSALSFVSAGVGLFSARLSIKSAKINSNPASAPLSKRAKYAGMAGAVTGSIGTVAGVVRSTLVATNTDSSALDPLLITMAVISVFSFAASATAVSYNFRAYKMNRAEAVKFAYRGIKSGPYENPMALLPSAPPPTPGTPGASAPFLSPSPSGSPAHQPTPAQFGFEGINFPVSGPSTDGLSNAPRTMNSGLLRRANNIRHAV